MRCTPMTQTRTTSKYVLMSPREPDNAPVWIASAPLYGWLTLEIVHPSAGDRRSALRALRTAARTQESPAGRRGMAAISIPSANQQPLQLHMITKYYNLLSS